jgi:hypothetical protein
VTFGIKFGRVGSRATTFGHGSGSSDRVRFP